LPDLARAGPLNRCSISRTIVAVLFMQRAVDEKAAALAQLEVDVAALEGELEAAAAALHGKDAEIEQLRQEQMDLVERNEKLEDFSVRP
jgi:chromosome segregation ATPase